MPSMTSTEGMWTLISIRPPQAAAVVGGAAAVAAVAAE